MTCFKKLKCWHILIPTIVFLEIVLACVFLARKVKTSSIIGDSSSQYILIGVFVVGLLLLVLVVICVFGCHNTNNRLGSSLWRTEQKPKQHHGYKIQNMMYPGINSTTKVIKPRKKRRINAGSLFLSKSKPFAVSSESFQYEHGSHYGGNSSRNYQTNTKVSTLRTASIGAGTLYSGNTFYPSTSRFKPGRRHPDILSNTQFKELYGFNNRDSLTDSEGSFINPKQSENLYGNYFPVSNRLPSLKKTNSHKREKKMDNSRACSNPPVLVSSGPFVQYNAPEATNIHMVYTEEDYSKVYNTKHGIMQQATAVVHSYPENNGVALNTRKRQVFRYGQNGNPDKTQHINATGSYTTQVRYINPSGKLVSYKVIKPKVIGAPVSVMVD